VATREKLRQFCRTDLDLGNLIPRNHHLRVLSSGLFQAFSLIRKVSLAMNQLLLDAVQL
jgi:hypothetical protein